MEGNKIKNLLNQIEPPTQLEERLLRLKTQVEPPEQLEEDLLHFKKPDNTKKRTESSGIARKSKSWQTVAAILAFSLLLTTGSVLAAAKIWGIRDIVKNLPGEGAQYINHNVETSDMTQAYDNPVAPDIDTEKYADLVSFEVKETLANSNAYIITVEATLKDPAHYIMMPNYSAGEPALPCYEDAADSEETFLEYASRMGKQLLYVTTEFDYRDTESLDKLHGAGQPGTMEDDCRALLHISGEDVGVFDETGVTEGIRIPILNSVSLVSGDSPDNLEYKICKEEALAVTCSNIATEQEVVTYASDAGEAVRIGDSPVLIKKVILTNDALESTVKIFVINEDKEVGNWIGVSPVHDNGDAYTPGCISPSGSASVPDSRGAFTIIDHWEKMEAPDHINVRAYSLYTDEFYGIITLPRVEE